MSADPQFSVRPAGGEPTIAAAATSTRTSDALPQNAFQRWLHRLAVLVFVFGCATVGMLLILIPWTPQWTSNSLLWGSPQLQAAAGSGFLRGLCSGLGILDLWIGFSHAIHYREGSSL